MKLTQKWVLLEGQTRPKLTWEFKDQIGLICERSKIVKREKKRKERSSKPRYGTLDYYLDHGIEWIHGTLRLCMINIMSPNIGFSLNCILTLDFLKLRGVKPTRNKISKEFPF